MAWYLNKYHCAACDVSWDDEWSCACDDPCPNCDAPIEAEDSIDLSIGFTEVNPQDPAGWTIVDISAEDAEDAPRYAAFGPFATRTAAEDFARQNGWAG